MDDVNVDLALTADAGKEPGERQSRQPLEDRALKFAAQFFGRVLLPLLGIKDEILRVAPTELVHLEIKDFIQDFNLAMVSGKMIHFEFASRPITMEDLMKFRSYEAVTSYYYKVEVVTCVICTARVKLPRREMKQGINRYRVLVFQLKEKDGDEVIRALEEKQQTQPLDQSELAELLLTPLMSGELGVAERIRRSLHLIQTVRENLEKEDLLRMESVLYTFAMKFLSKAELEDMKEAFGMTVLGQMLEDRGVEKGLKEGLKDGLAQGIIKTCRKLGASREDTLATIVSEVKLTAAEAEKYLLRYWKA